MKRTLQPPRREVRPRSVEELALNFQALRDEGLHWLQKLAGERWTDHNLHDPGITLLEQLCFGLTDLVYRSGFPVADHLAGPGHEIDYQALSLHPADAVFPCRATTREDHRRWLLDHVPGLDDASVDPLQDMPGVYQLRLKPSEWLVGEDESEDEDAGDAPQSDAAAQQARYEVRIAEARKAWHAQRNLGEDLAPQVHCDRDVMCELQAAIDIDGERDAVQILADVYDRCARFIAGAPVADTLHDLMGAGQTLADIYDGPVMRHGFLRPSPLSANGVRRLFLSDVAEEMRRVPGVVDARVIAIVPDEPDPDDFSAAGQDMVVGSVAWFGEGWALSLHLPSVQRPTKIEVRRRGLTVDVSARELRRRLNDLQTAGRARRSRQQADQAEQAKALLPTGTHRDLSEYRSVQRHLPAVYGLGRHGVPPSAPPQVKAQVKQLKAYLLLHEQMLAQGLAQLQAMRSLFSLDNGARQTLWIQPLTEAQIPGLAELLDGPAERDEILQNRPFASTADIARAQQQRLDGGTARKRRVLDHLLALHGETYTQNSMRQFCGHLLHEELDTLLLENKAAWLRDIVTLARDRAAGVDLTRPSWGQMDNCSGLQRRASLRLGFRLWHDRPLTRVPRDHRVMIDAQNDSEDSDSVGSPATITNGGGGLVPLPPEFSDRGMAAGTSVRPATRQQVQEDMAQMPWLRRQRLPVSLTRTAARADRYRLLPAGSAPMTPPPTLHLQVPPADSPGLEDDPAPHAALFALPQPDPAPGCRLVLGPDENGRWWVIGSFKTEDAARRAAASLRLFMLHLDQECEGLHLLEHVLLRPVRAQSPEHQQLKLPLHFHRLRITAVLPGWTTRTAQKNFRQFARETLRSHTPAHLSLSVQWLSLEDMQAFETLYEEWLDSRLALSSAPEDVRAQTRTDRVAARLIELMLSWPPTHERPAPSAPSAPAAPPEGSERSEGTEAPGAPGGRSP